MKALRAGIDVASACQLVDIILHFLADPFLPCVTLTLFRGASVYYIRRRISVRSIGCVISCAIDTRENVSPGDQFPSFEIYYTCLSHSMPWTREKWTKTNRPLRRPDVELYSNERQIAITFPEERRYLLPWDRVSTCKCGDVRKRLHEILLVNILWPVFI